MGEEFRNLSIEELRKRIRETGLLTGAPAAVIKKDMAIDVLSGALKPDDAIRAMIPASGLVKSWVENNRKDLLSDAPVPPVPKKEAAPATQAPPAPPKLPAPEPKAPTQAEPKPGATESKKTADDPRAHPHWPVLLATSKAMQIDMEAALAYFVDQQKDTISRLEARIQELERQGIPQGNMDEWGLDPDYEPTEAVLDGLEYMKRDRPIGFVGPAGTGKTQGAIFICKTLKRPYVKIELHEEARAEDMEGLAWIEVENGVQVMKWVFGAVVFAMQNGKVLIADEWDRAGRSVHHLFNNIVESRQLTIKTGPRAGEVIRAEKGFNVIFTANTVNGSDGQFSSTSLDHSSRSRFRIIEVDFDAKLERKRMDKVQGLSDQDKGRIQRLFASARDLFRKGEISLSLGTRHLVHMAQDVADGLPMRKAWLYNACTHAGRSFEDEHKRLLDLYDRTA